MYLYHQTIYISLLGTSSNKSSPLHLFAYRGNQSQTGCVPTAAGGNRRSEVSAHAHTVGQNIVDLNSGRICFATSPISISSLHGADSLGICDHVNQSKGACPSSARGKCGQSVCRDQMHFAGAENNEVDNGTGVDESQSFSERICRDEHDALRTE